MRRRRDAGPCYVARSHDWNAPVRRLIALILGMGLLLVLPAIAAAWGLAAHAMIARQAVESVPGTLGAFLRENRERVVEHVIEPDNVLKRRYGRRERIRHYTNLENLAAPPFTDIPPDYDAARARYGRARLERAGILPWITEQFHRRLVEAMKRRDARETLRLSGLLGHYVADAFAPLHSTRNHDGQLTGNRGIHEYYETEMIRRRAKFFRDLGPLAPVPERAAPRVSARILVVLREGYAAVPAILAADTAARERATPPRVAYLDRVFQGVGTQARDRMRAAARETAALWTSAWVEAGRPDLRNMGQVGGSGRDRGAIAR